MALADVKLNSYGQLVYESQQISVAFTRTDTVGHVSWNIPSPSAGCEGDDQAYCGAVVVVAETDKQSFPDHHVKYKADSNIDDNLFSGDSIGEAKVIASLEHDRITNKISFSGLDKHKNYFVTVFPMSCDGKYYSQGISAFIRADKLPDIQGTPGSHTISINSPDGVSDFDQTCLEAKDYKFKIKLGTDAVLTRPLLPGECRLKTPEITITIPGSQASTYDELVSIISSTINKTLADHVGVKPPKFGSIVLVEDDVFVWNGHSLEPKLSIAYSKFVDELGCDDYSFNPINPDEVIEHCVEKNRKPISSAPFDPTDVIPSNTVWIKGDKFYRMTSDGWDLFDGLWKSETEPTPAEQDCETCNPNGIQAGDIWYNIKDSAVKEYNGACFTDIPVLKAKDLEYINERTIWRNTLTDNFFIFENGKWIPLEVFVYPGELKEIPIGLLQVQDHQVWLWTGISWQLLTTSDAKDVHPANNSSWFDTNCDILKTWDGNSWIEAQSFVDVELNCNGYIKFTYNWEDSRSLVKVTDIDLFSSLCASVHFEDPVKGNDGFDGTPTYNQLGIGDDGNTAQMDAAVNDMLYQMGYPVVNVELTREQLTFAINRAVQIYRQRAAGAYRKEYMFLNVERGHQQYVLTNQQMGYHKIVSVLGAFRVSNSYMSSVYGSVFGQMLLQQMYQGGLFDFTTYYAMHEYAKLMELIFASRITFNWNEQTRTLKFYKRFAREDTAILLEVATERTIQELLSDRYAGPWIKRYAMAEARTILAEIRGKFSSLAGASGPISFNASELRAAADSEKQLLIQELDSYVADTIEEYGGSAFVVVG